MAESVSSGAPILGGSTDSAGSRPGVSPGSSPAKPTAITDVHATLGGSTNRDAGREGVVPPGPSPTKPPAITNDAAFGGSTNSDAPCEGVVPPSASPTKPTANTNDATLDASSNSAAPLEDVAPPSPTNPTAAAADAKGRKQQRHRHKLAWLRAALRAPLRALRALRDSYERGMARCAESHVAMAGGGFAMGATYPPLPRSYSSRSRSSDTDERELVRAASQTMLATRVLPAAVGPDGVPRSRSAVVWRIDEDKEADFGDGGGFPDGKWAAYPRSRSYAVGRVPAAAGAGVAGSGGPSYQRRVGVTVA